jgi:hypothetical protein
MADDDKGKPPSTDDWLYGLLHSRKAELPAEAMDSGLTCRRFSPIARLVTEKQSARAAVIALSSSSMRRFVWDRLVTHAPTIVPTPATRIVRTGSGVSAQVSWTNRADALWPLSMWRTIDTPSSPVALPRIARTSRCSPRSQIR